MIQVRPLHQLDAHLPGQEAVLEIGRIERPGGEQHHLRVAVRVPGRDAAQGLRQAGRIVIDALHARGIHRPRHDPLGDQPVLQHVAHAARRAEVVFQHPEGARGVADQVDAADVDAHAPGRTDPAQPGQIVSRGEHQLLGNAAFGEDELLAVHVVEEEREGPDALDQAALELRPVGRRDGPREQAEGEDLLRPALIVEDGEGDALVEQRQLGQRLAAAELLGGFPPEGGERLRHRLPHFAIDASRLMPPPEEDGRRQAGAGRASKACPDAARRASRTPARRGAPPP